VHVSFAELVLCVRGIRPRSPGALKRDYSAVACRTDNGGTLPWSTGPAVAVRPSRDVSR